MPTLEWAPDGTLLALQHGDVVSMDLDGGNQVKVTEGADLDTFAMSPDGKRIVLADNDTRLLIAPVGAAARQCYSLALCRRSSATRGRLGGTRAHVMHLTLGGTTTRMTQIREGESRAC